MLNKLLDEIISDSLLNENDVQIKALIKPELTVGEIPSGEFFATTMKSEKVYSHAHFPIYAPQFFDDASLVTK